ncbi:MULTISPECIES: hypothetical protein [Flavobacteriaceae]|uniref:hypothetical protein n=1 Tax=Flavobacteriaceae TaxID=49546 RepID=UPI001491FBD7|nr:MULTISPECIES: hypothetical protein [Allomuricauda]MDC6366756.1 hypothetical protein [Muricauda sp. AC10]
MKNTRKAALIFLGSLLLMLGSCKQVQKEETSEPALEKPREEKVAPPQGIISLEESKSLYDNYSKNRVEIIQAFELETNDDENFKAARFSSFGYEEIKQYMAFIEQEAKGAGVDISSLRLYFANYPNKKDFPDGKKIVHPRQNSIFIVPTMKVDGHEYGFYIGEDGKAKLIKNAVGANEIGSTQKTKQRSYASFAPTTSAPATYASQSLTLNRGSAGPPPDADY